MRVIELWPAEGDYETVLWMELWVRALRDPRLEATRVRLDRRWRAVLADVVRAGQAQGEFGPVDPGEFALLLSAVMDGFAIQVALRDPDVPVGLVRRAVPGPRGGATGVRAEVQTRGAHVRRDVWDQSLNRRQLLRGGAGAALALGMAGCGVGTGDSGGTKAAKKATEKVVKAEPDGDLVYFNWSEYLDPKLMKEFAKRYGVKVRESNFDAMQGMMAKLRSGNRYDIIFPTSEYVDRLRHANQLLRIDTSPAEELRLALRPLRQAVVRPGGRPHGALRDVRERAALPHRQGRRHERLLERPRPRTWRRGASTCSTTTRR